MTRDDALSTAQVAEMYGIQMQTVRNWIKKGIIKGKKIGRSIVYYKEDLPLLGPRGKIFQDIINTLPEKEFSLMDTEDLALYLGIDKEKIPKLIENGLPHGTFKDGQVFIKSQVDLWLRSLVKLFF